MLRMRRVVALVATVVFTLLPVAACSDDDDSKPAEPEDQAALISAVNEQLEVDPAHDNLRAVLVQVDGKPVLEQYYDWPADTYWDVESATGSILSALVGIAIEEGDIDGTDETLVELLPDHAAEMSPDVAETTLRKLLTMTAGFAGLDRDRTPEYMADPDPVGRILRAAPDPLGGGFEVSNQGAHVVSAVLAEATGMSVLDYARSRLFEPLGIDSRPAFEAPLDARNMDEFVAADFAWPVDGAGLQLGWGGLKLRPADLARFGQLMLDRGKWKGEQLVPADWVRDMTTEQVDTVSQRNQPANAAGKFGYLWWITDADGEPAYLASGSGGQLLEVVPSMSLVVVVASEIEYGGSQSGGFSSTALTFLVDHVIAPAVAQEAAGQAGS
jgi:CubicO group peptidase (beta-lactamase class C family)